jgi:uncharacterized protein (DUF736 family)
VDEVTYDNTNSGALFRNKEKQEARHPDYRGSLNVDGAEYWISSWLKTSKANEKYMSLSVQPKKDKQKEAPKAREPGEDDDFDDDIPFN